MSLKRKAATRPGGLKSGEFQTEAERDSGFSDGNSEYLSTMDTTDSEDSPGPAVDDLQSNGTPGGTPRPLAMVGGSYSGLSPMIIMNNVLLKQSGDGRPALKPWRFSPGVEVVQPVVQQPQVVFLQPLMSRQTPSASKDPASSSSSRHRRSKKYLPILKSYPKIAPRDCGSSSSSSGRGTSSLPPFSSASSSTSSERSVQSDHSHKTAKSHSSRAGSATPPLPQTQSVVPPVQSKLAQLSPTDATVVLQRDGPGVSESTPELPERYFDNIPQAAPGSQLFSEGQADADGDGDSRRKRFCNTYNILSRSGLLDITLRTKELLRQNKRTQSDLERLREHTDLFLHALRSGDSGVCAKLQASLRQEETEGKESEGR